MLDAAPKRLSLLYQLYVTNQAARGLMRLVMAGTGMSGEEYALHSYLYANGPRTLSQAARDLGLPITTLATLLAPAVESGLVERRRHPRDRRARLLRLTDAGRQRLAQAIPTFSAGYRAVLAELEADGADVEGLYTALEQLRRAVVRAEERMVEAHATG
jgi:DNA-binding MarR family transcriptional regulator